MIISFLLTSVIGIITLIAIFSKPSECMKNTGGANCEKCLLGFFGEALATDLTSDSISCQPCKCNRDGSLYYDKTSLPRCSPITGECNCKLHVEGRDIHIECSKQFK